MYLEVYTELGEVIGLPEARITGGCEPPNLGSGTRTWVLEEQQVLRTTGPWLRLSNLYFLTILSIFSLLA